MDAGTAERGLQGVVGDAQRAQGAASADQGTVAVKHEEEHDGQGFNVGTLGKDYESSGPLDQQPDSYERCDEEDDVGAGKDVDASGELFCTIGCRFSNEAAC